MGYLLVFHSPLLLMGSMPFQKGPNNLDMPGPHAVRLICSMTKKPYYMGMLEDLLVSQGSPLNSE